MVGMPPGLLPLELDQSRPMGWKPRGRPRMCRRNYFSQLAWEHPGIPQEELVSVPEDRNVSADHLSFSHLNPHQKK